MSIFVSDFQSAAPAWVVVHDDALGGAHTGTIDPTEVVHTQTMDGTPSHQFAVVVCPVCGSVSTAPVGGGAQPALVQQMFVELALREGCPCPEGLARDTELTVAEDHVKKHCEEMDGVGRWQLDTVAA
jgi:hypothetical protein